MARTGSIKLRASEFFRSRSQFVAVEPRNPQPRFPLHEHDFNEIVIVASGNGWHILNDEPHLITCGELFYIRAEDHHAFEEVNDLYLTNVLYRTNDGLLQPDRLRPYLEVPEEGGRRRHWQLTEDALAQVKPLLESLLRETWTQDPLSEAMAESLFLQLTVLLRRNRFATDSEHLPPAARFGHVLAYLRHNYTRHVDLDGLAHRFGYSPRNFSRIFREATAITPHGYLVRLRLARAMRALRNTDNSVTDIAFASGFNDSNYFSYAFNKMAGLSPSEYRRQARLP